MINKLFTKTPYERFTAKEPPIGGHGLLGFDQLEVRNEVKLVSRASFLVAVLCPIHVPLRFLRGDIF